MKLAFDNFIFVVFLIFATVVNAQKQDAELWTTIEFDAKILKKTELSIETSMRRWNNYAALKSGYQQIGIQYKLTEFADISGGYRLLIGNEIDKGNSLRHRFFIATSLKKSSKRWEIEYKIQYQNDYVKYYSGETGKTGRKHSRHKISVEYDIKNVPIDLFVNYEIFYNHTYYREVGFDEYRYTGGIRYKINKRNRLSVFFRLSEERGSKIPENTYILGISYKKSFGKLFKKIESPKINENESEIINNDF